MPEPIPRRCNAPGCGEFGVWKRGYCPGHSRRRGGHSHAPMSMESERNRRAYRDAHVVRMFVFNYICQRIIGGARCDRPSQVLHHLRDPQTARELYDPRNGVMLCREHHPGGRAGTPEWREGVDYAPTVWAEPSF